MTHSARLSFLMDNQAHPAFRSEHGLSVWVEKEGRAVLFDTGASPLLLENAKAMGIDLSRAEAIVLSHGHYDHTGGLDAVLDIVPCSIPVIACRGAARRRYAVRDNDNREIGFRGSPASRQRLELLDGPRELLPGVWATGPIPRLHELEDPGGPFFLDPAGRTQDWIEDDQALVLLTGERPSVLFGCAHAGIINTLEYVVNRFDCKAFDTLAGGLHLHHASEQRLQWTLRQLGRWWITNIAPCHCTGTAPMGMLRELKGIRYLDCLAGTTLTV